MKPLVLLAAVFGVCSSSLAQTFDLVSSSNTVSYAYFVGGNSYDFGDSDADEVELSGAEQYPDPTYDGYVRLNFDLLARHGEDPYDPIVFVEAHDCPRIDIAGRLQAVGASYENSASAVATYEVYGANPLDLVDLKVTFSVGFEEIEDIFLVHAGSVTAGGEYWSGGALSDASWYMMSPSYSSNVPYLWDTPEGGVYESFNLVVDPGSRVTLTADAFDAMSSQVFEVPPLGLGFGSCGVWSLCSLEIL